MDVPDLFIQNQKVNEFNERVHNAATGEKFSIKAIDMSIALIENFSPVAALCTLSLNSFTF